MFRAMTYSLLLMIAVACPWVAVICIAIAWAMFDDGRQRKAAARELERAKVADKAELARHRAAKSF